MFTTVEEIRRDDSAIVSIKTAAAVLKLDPRTVSKGIADGTIPSIRIGKRVLIPRERFLALFGSEDE